MKRLAAILVIFSVSLCRAQDSPHGELAIKCDVCHSSDSWSMRSGSPFDHSTTGFPLLGQHRQIPCATCHGGLVFKKKDPLCTSCHTDVHKNELGTNCLRCHKATSWLVADMTQRHQETRFPLQGKHAITDCEACHNRPSPNRYAGTPLDCITCHRSEYEATSAPPHAVNGFGTDCTPCHNQASLSWPGGFDHASTGFPLVGAHKSLQCQSCHTNNQFKQVAADCYTCHQSNYQSTTNPGHVAGNFSHDCTGCHSMTAWTPATFDHSTTHFALTGAHRSIQCQSCHVNGNYTLVYQNCYQCHQVDYQSTTDPNHVALGYSHDCQNCHTTTSWGGATIDHSTTKFPLTGAHVSVQCATCHANNNYTLAYTDCYMCHQPEYTQQTNPNHAAANFSHDCSGCHTTTLWSGATFNHSTTKFPLTGAHVAVQCATCHTNGNYSLTYTDCYMCHQADYQRPTDPSHAAANFSHDCSGCHTTTVWTGGTFNHSATNFPLTGAHVTVQCGLCHVSQNYQISYSGCYTCHAADYNATTNPIHSSAGFPTTCETCHTTTSWSGATFNHTWFPITHGASNGVCSKCHTNPNDYSVFQCTDCHTQSVTDSHHTSVAGYVYNSINCYQCHPNGTH